MGGETEDKPCTDPVEFPGIVYNYSMQINSYSFDTDFDDEMVLKLDGIYYFPVEFIGKALSHKYSFEGAKIELYIVEQAFTISETDGEFVFEKTNSDFNALCDIYIAYYSKNQALISTEKYRFETGEPASYSYDKSNPNVKEIRAFIWEKDTLKPLGKSKSIKLTD